MANIPNEIIVGGISYKVTEQETVEMNGDKNYYGYCKYDVPEIKLKSGLSDDRKEQTLIHEITHAAFFEAGLDQDEDTVNRLSIVLYNVLKNNALDFYTPKLPQRPMVSIYDSEDDGA